MFRRSNNGGLFFTRREMDSKENVFIFVEVHDYGNCCKFQNVNLRVTHRRSIG